MSRGRKIPNVELLASGLMRELALACIALMAVSESWGLPALGRPGNDGPDGKISVEVRMPGVTTSAPDEYICTATRLPANEMFVERYEPIADMAKAHHMLLYACGELPTSAPTWPCKMTVPCRYRGCSHNATPPYSSGSMCLLAPGLTLAWS